MVPLLRPLVMLPVLLPTKPPTYLLLSVVLFVSEVTLLALDTSSIVFVLVPAIPPTLSCPVTILSL